MSICDLTVRVILVIVLPIKLPKGTPSPRSTVQQAKFLAHVPAHPMAFYTIKIRLYHPRFDTQCLPVAPAMTCAQVVGFTSFSSFLPLLFQNLMNICHVKICQVNKLIISQKETHFKVCMLC